MGKAIAAHCPHLLKLLVDLLGPYHNHKVDGSRVVMASMFAAFLKHCQNQSEDLIDGMVGILMGGLADANIAVRKVCKFLFSVVKESAKVASFIFSSAYAVWGTWLIVQMQF